MDDNIKRIGYKFVNQYYKIKLLKALSPISPLIQDIKKLNTFIDNRTKSQVIMIKLQDWISSTFDELTFLISKPEIVSNFTNFINIYNKYNPNDTNIRKDITTHKFLSMWMILAYPEFIIDLKFNEIDETKRDYKTDLYILTKELLFTLNSIITDLENNNKVENETLRTFNKRMNLYINCFDYFLLINKQEKVNSYIKEWCSLEKSVQLISLSEHYNDNEKEKSIDIINKSKQILEKYMNKFNIDISYNVLKENVNFNIKFENEFKKDYENNLKLELDNKNYDSLRNILLETKDFIKKFTKISEEELNEHIDIDFIIQVIKFEVISHIDIINFGVRVINDICLAGSYFLNQKQLNRWRSTNIIQDTNILISKLLILCLESINEIYEEIIAYKEFISLNS